MANINFNKGWSEDISANLFQSTGVFDEENYLLNLNFPSTNDASLQGNITSCINGVVSTYYSSSSWYRSIRIIWGETQSDDVTPGIDVNFNISN